MKLSDLLFQYDDNKTFVTFLDAAMENPYLYVEIKEENDFYNIVPKNLFLKALVVSSANLKLDKKLNIIEESCSCLQYYKKKTCIHILALYSLAIMILDKDLFDKEYEIYKNKKQKIMHNEILDSLFNIIRDSNPYFGQIHLVPIIEIIQNEYVLSIKIGYDKDYIVKDINEFIDATENNKVISYGQRLEFVHSYECFDDVSKDFYTFISNIITLGTQKFIKLKKSHILKILELYSNNQIIFKLQDELKPSIRQIIENADSKLILDQNKLFILPPNNSKLLVSGKNRAYFIDDNNIYFYYYKNELENKIYNYLFKINGHLAIEVHSDKFISSLLPLIRRNIEIKEEFFERYPIPNVKINTYLSYDKNVIYILPKIACSLDDRASPYIKELLNSYLDTIELIGFVKSNKNYALTDLEKQYMLLTSDLDNLKTYGEVYYDESIKNIKAKKSKRTSINVRYDVGLLDFSLLNDELSKEDIKLMLDAYHKNDKFVRLEDGSILEINEDHAKEIDDFLEDFNISILDIDNDIRKPLYYLLKLLNGVDSNVNMDNDVLKMISKIQGYKKSSFMPNKQYLPLLRNYQIEGFKWLKTLADFSFGGILADDMGLGKTLEIISFIDSDDEIKPSLIVCPMSLVYNWENECIKWEYKYPVKLILGSAEERLDIINNIKENEKVLYITSYDSLRRDISLYKNSFRFIIADEAQFIKNHYTQKSEAIKLLKSDINFALTGTPIENGLQDLWSIFDFLLPGYLSNYSHFRHRYESLILADDTNALYNLRNRVTPFILRRTKKDVLNDLPEKIEEYYYYKMGQKQRDVYNNYVLELKDDLEHGGNNILALLTRLRQVCITPELINQEVYDNTKINMAIDIIKSSILAGHRILLFSQFSLSFPIISKELENLDIKNFILDG